MAERSAQVEAVAAEPLPRPPPVEPIVEAVHQAVAILAAAPSERPDEQPGGDAPPVAAGREVEPDAVTQRPDEDAPDPDEPDLPEPEADPEGAVRVDVSADGVEVETPRADVSVGPGGVAVGVAEPAERPEQATEPVRRGAESVAPESGLRPQPDPPAPDERPDAGPEAEPAGEPEAEPAGEPAAPEASAADVQQAVDVAASCAERPGATAADCLAEAFEADPEAAGSLREQARDMFGDVGRTPSQQPSIPGGWPTP